MANRIMGSSVRGAMSALAAGLGAALMLFTGGPDAFADPPDDPSTTTATTTTTTTTTAEQPELTRVVGNLSLEPDHGAPGTRVTATATNFRPCVRSATAMWDGAPLDSAKMISADVDSGTVTLSFTVPAGATAGTYPVQAACATGSGTVAVAVVVTTESAEFSVPSAEKPTLTLDPTGGPADSQVRASGTGFACDSEDVRLVWDSGEPLAVGLPGTFTVPPTATARGHRVGAFCRGDPDAVVWQPFDVTSTETPVTTRDEPPASTPALALAPGRGAPRTTVQAMGTGFDCARTADVFWDDGIGRLSVGVDASGRFDTPLTVPAGAAPGRHTVYAACTGETPSAQFGFTVSGMPPPPSRPWRWLIPLVAGAAVVLGGGYLFRRSRARHAQANTDVRAVAHPDPHPTVTVHETPGPGEVTHVLRLVPHPDSGTQTLVEV